MIHLVNPSHLSFGVGVITPRWLFVLAGATPPAYGRPQIVDETLEPLNLDTVQAGDVVGIGIHTGNALRGYDIGTRANARGAHVVFGGIHATLFPDEAHQLGSAIQRFNNRESFPSSDAGNGRCDRSYQIRVGCRARMRNDIWNRFGDVHQDGRIGGPHLDDRILEPQGCERGKRRICYNDF
jgi:hypothetical protein